MVRVEEELTPSYRLQWKRTYQRERERARRAEQALRWQEEWKRQDLSWTRKARKAIAANSLARRPAKRFKGADIQKILQKRYSEDTPDVDH